MKAIFLVVLALAGVPKFAGADVTLGSQCGLTDGYYEDGWVELSSINLTRASNRYVSGLPTLTKQQLVIAANDVLSEIVEHTDPVESAVDAVKLFRDSSDNADLVVVDFRVGNRYYTAVVYYPGDNPAGVIFKRGHRSIVADIGDSNVVCR